MLKSKGACVTCHFACDCREARFSKLYEELLYLRERVDKLETLWVAGEELLEEINGIRSGREVLEDLDVAYALRQWDNSVEELEKPSENN